MKKKILTILLIGVLAVTLTGCGKKVVIQNNPIQNNTKTEKVDAINDNSSYFIKIKGKKFSAGDKISSVSKVGLKQDSRYLDQKVNKNTYLIGGGTIYNSSDKRVMSMTPFNTTSEAITVKDAVIGGLEVGEYEYDKISAEVLELNVEVVGGIKLGSTLKDIEKVFGKTTDTYYADSLGYTTYTYKSSEVYRSYEFTIGKDGKVSKIRWQNLVFNR